ncbi:hypothetical protein BX661DRAFT_183471 [Kickxella alabastrina]|uniref:uncharacterized protein n=1 Tax=Kickxella alabastrina TaxID=61397 RepID=UPI00221ED44E|nr:uncharacterized protein BX661DRAFT_183471 [Kickxella alabastrina]KAI7826787.1 hypothetical protein BX661DRAFT_183471 [Kickxella alabastrina]
MFKKQFQTKPRTPLKSSVCRRLVQESKESFPAAWALVESEHSIEAETDVEANAETETESVDVKTEHGDKAAGFGSQALRPMPSKLQMAKFISHIGEKGEIYYDSTGNPLWLKTELYGCAKTQRLVPTVYTQWRFSDMMPILWTWPQVVEKLINGADLMVPGLIVPQDGLPDLKSGTIVAICCPGNLAAQAVGVLTFDTKDVHSVIGAKGKAVLITHTYKDHLWESGSKAKLPEIAIAVAALEDDELLSGEKHIGDDDCAEQIEHSCGVTLGGEQDEHIVELSPSEMDGLLMEVLKQIMATVLDANHATGLLPINASTVYSNYMVPNAPRGKEVDIKRSSYKKLAKFLKAAEKHGLIKLKDIRGETHIKSFDWAHRDMATFQPYKVPRIKSDRPAAESSAAFGAAAGVTASSGTSASEAHSGGSGMIQIIELFKPSHALAPLFEDVGAQSESGFLSRQQARAVLEQYIKDSNLVDPKNPRMIKLDHRLCDGLLTKEEYSKMNAMPRDKLQARLQEKMTLYTQVMVPGQTPGAPKIGSPAAVEIVCEKKMGNKVVTRIAGLEAYGVDPAVIAKELRIVCASSTGIDSIPGKKNAQSVLVQGHQVAAVTKLLERHGLPSQLLKVTDKSGKAVKKQGAGASMGKAAI